MTIPQKIKMALAYKGMSEAELSRAIGTSPSAFNQRMKTGKFSSEDMGEEETMMAGTWKVTYKATVSRRMDTTALKKVLGDALEGYYKTVVTRPFKII